MFIEFVFCTGIRLVNEKLVTFVNILLGLEFVMTQKEGKATNV